MSASAAAFGGLCYGEAWGKSRGKLPDEKHIQDRQSPAGRKIDSELAHRMSEQR
jgi:hypothetical protein